MEITKTTNGTALELRVSGSVNSATSEQFARELEDLEGTERLTIDFRDMDYISSAGLRVLFAAEKKMRAQGGQMVLTHLKEEVLEVFEITGFVDIFTIE